MYAKRMNKTYPVNTAEEKQAYLSRGYDIHDDSGHVIAYSPAKTVPYGEHVALQKEFAALLAEYNELVKLKAAGNEPPADIIDTEPPDNPGNEDSEGDVKTLHPAEDNAPKMGADAKAAKGDRK